jgi:RsiW-degrading membrane proteinase PrsW (M82 family)
MLSKMDVLILALLGGIIPAFFWLWFWLREDRLRPEPKSALASAFIGGIIAVFVALFCQLVIYYIFADANPYYIKDFPDLIRIPLLNLADNLHLIDKQIDFWNQVRTFFYNLGGPFFSNLDIKNSFLVIIIAPITEEILKLLFTYNICLRRKVNDEPIDSSIYMLTAALGFAAIETMLFLTGSMNNSGTNAIDTLIVGSNYRSIGPMLIHLVSSAILGLFIGLAFYGGKIKKFIYLIAGLIIAIVLHSLFNFFITINKTTNNMIYFWVACLGTWFMVVILLVFFEKVKRVARKII